MSMTHDDVDDWRERERSSHSRFKNREEKMCVTLNAVTVSCEVCEREFLRELTQYS